jgi:hypothetical protein
MSFGRKTRGTEAGRQATALVVEADAPPQGATRRSNVGKATVRILVDAGAGPIVASRSSHLKKEQWLVAGMEVPVAIDPNQPDRFEVRWEAIPDIEARAAANDPVLADPLAARQKVVEALTSAGIAAADPRAASADRFKEAMEKAAQEPAPAGKRRAVVLISTIRPHMYQASEHGPSQRTTEGKNNAVLAVNVPGQAPYAVYVKKFKKPRGQGDVTGAGLPAIVSASDPSDVEVLWKELPSLMSQVAQRMSDSMQGQAGMLGGSQPQPAVGGSPGATPAPGPAVAGQMNAQTRAMLAQNAKRALVLVQDPTQREMLIEQYRSAGIPVDEGDRVVPPAEEADEITVRMKKLDDLHSAGVLTDAEYAAERQKVVDQL